MADISLRNTPRQSPLPVLYVLYQLFSPNNQLEQERLDTPKTARALVSQTQVRVRNPQKISQLPVGTSCDFAIWLWPRNTSTLPTVSYAVVGDDT